MPTAWAPIVTRVWSRVARAIFSPAPTSPTTRSPGMRVRSKMQLAGGAALDAELALLLAEGEARVVLLDDERRDVVAALAVGVGDREHGVELRDTGVGDPRLLAGEHPVVAVAHRAALHRGGVGAGLALGQAVGERRLPGGERGEVAALHVVVRGEDERHRAELVDRRDERAAGADPGDLLDDDAGRERVGPDAAVLLGHVRREEVARDQRVVRLLRVARRPRRPRPRTGRSCPRPPRGPPRGSPRGPRRAGRCRTRGCRSWGSCY